MSESLTIYKSLKYHDASPPKQTWSVKKEGRVTCRLLNRSKALERNNQN